MESKTSFFILFGVRTSDLKSITAFNIFFDDGVLNADLSAASLSVVNGLLCLSNGQAWCC